MSCSFKLDSPVINSIPHGVIMSMKINGHLIHEDHNMQVCITCKPGSVMLQLNKSLTLNHHSTQSHLPQTLEWSCSVGPCKLIHYCINFPFSYPKLILKKPTLLYQEVHSLFTFLLNKTQLYQKFCHKKASKVSRERTSWT